MEHPSVNESCKFRSWYPDTTGIVPVVALEGVIIGTSVALNVVLLVTVCSSRHLRTSTHIFISSLAVSDILAAVYGLIRLTIITVTTGVCFPLATKDLINRGLTAFYMVNEFSSYMNILIVSGERWLYISRPFQHQRLISPRFTFVGVVVAWASSLIVNLDAFIFTLNDYWIISDFKYLVLLPCFHSLLTVVLCFIYFQLTIITRRQMKAINKTSYLRPTNNEDPRSFQLMATKMKQLKANLKSIRLLVTVFGGFLLLLSPRVYYHLYSYLMLSGEKLQDPTIHEGLKILTYLHMLENFIVFARLDKRFRSVLITWLRRARCRHATCVGQGRIMITGCRGCRGGNKVGADEGNS